MVGGKFAPGLRGFPTPNDVADDGGYIVFRIPKNNEWAGLILGAAQLLSYTYNYYQWGDMTPDEASEAFRVIVDQAPYNSLVCSMPGGGKIIRINATGHLQELGDDGEWQDPTGDYEVPPVTPRSGGTPSDQNCLAAANATNVLKELYEQVVDGIAEGLSILELIALVLAAIATLIAGAIGLAAAALIEIILIAFREFIAAAAFLGADVWDETFTHALQCMLFSCASNSGGVVTFDWDCLVEELYNNTHADLTGNQIRLLGQVGYLLNIISIDGLNLAGATTAITTADCSDCPQEWCVVMDFSVDDYGLQSACYHFPTAACDAVYGSGTWHDNLGATGTGVSRFCLTEIDFGRTYHFTEVSNDCYVQGTGAPMTMGTHIYTNTPGGSPDAGVQIPVSNDHFGVVLDLDDDIQYFQFQTNVSPAGGGDAATGHSYMTRIVFRGTGDKPDLPDCEE